MSFHFWRKTRTKMSDSQVNKNPSKEGNAVTEGDGKTGMEYKPVVRKPFWENAGEFEDLK